MDFNNVVTHRRAVNYFDPKKEVSDEQLKAMIETAAHAPSSFNLQPWNLIVVRDPKKKAELKKLAWDQPKVAEAPVILVVLADRSGWGEGHPTVEKVFQEFIKGGTMQAAQRDWFRNARDTLYGRSQDSIQAFACKNAGFFGMMLMLAAKNLGLDTHPMDGFDHDAVREYFNLPDHFWIPLLLAVGHFDEEKELAPPKWRKSVEEIIHSVY